MRNILRTLAHYRTPALHGLLVLTLIDFFFNRLFYFIGKNILNTSYLPKGYAEYVAPALFITLFIASLALLLASILLFEVLPLQKPLFRIAGVTSFLFVVTLLIRLGIPHNGGFYFTLVLLSHVLFLFALTAFFIEKVKHPLSEGRRGITVFLFASVLFSVASMVAKTLHPLLNLPIPDAFLRYCANVSGYSFVIAALYCAFITLRSLWKDGIAHLPFAFSIVLLLMGGAAVALSGQSALFITTILSSFGGTLLFPPVIYGVIFLFLFFSVFYQLLSVESENRAHIAVLIVLLTGIHLPDPYSPFLVLVAFTFL